MPSTTQSLMLAPCIPSEPWLIGKEVEPEGLLSLSSKALIHVLPCGASPSFMGYFSRDLKAEGVYVFAAANSGEFHTREKRGSIFWGNRASPVSALCPCSGSARCARHARVADAARPHGTSDKPRHDKSRSSVAPSRSHTAERLRAPRVDRGRLPRFRRSTEGLRRERAAQSLTAQSRQRNPAAA